MCVQESQAFRHTTAKINQCLFHSLQMFRGRASPQDFQVNDLQSGYQLRFQFECNCYGDSILNAIVLLLKDWHLKLCENFV